MITALNNWLRDHPIKKIVLIGYSGGGTIAVLMAAKLKQVSAVVTLSANLDVNGWRAYHRYSALTDSLNPVEQKSLSSQIKQLHLAGGKDDNVPAFVIQNYVQQQPDAIFKIYPAFDHDCCWVSQWKQILKQIQALESKAYFGR
jgi:dienelactone hydrolase